MAITFSIRRLVAGLASARGQLFKSIVCYATDRVSHFGHEVKFWSLYGSSARFRCLEEDMTLPLSGTTLDSTNTGLLPANSLILGVTWRIIDAITGATSIGGGISGTPEKYISYQTTYTAGTKVQVPVTGASQPQTADAAFRLTWTGTATAGKLRVSVWALTFTAPQVS